MSKKLEDYTKEELLAYITKLKKDTKFGLVWNPKEEQVAIDCETKVPVLQEVADKTIRKATDDDPVHLLLEGDNYHSLSVLNYTHAGKVDVMYIDPPYNTGSKDFMYNDRYVDRDDPYRHSQWLSFMDNRLRLAKNLLADTGVIFISIDDNEQAHLRILCDKIFGEDNFINRLTWESTTQPINTGPARFGLQRKTELIFCYAKNKKKMPQFVLEVVDSESSYPHQGKFGKCRFEIIEKSDSGSYARQSMKYEILGQKPRAGKRWQIGEQTARELLERGRIEVIDGIVKKAVYPEDEEDKVSYKPFWAHFSASDVGTAQNAKDELNKVLGFHAGFDTVKPVKLITEITSHFRNNAIVLDFFAGSGTTGHAVLKLNNEDGGNRQFILCTNNENGIAENITYERIKKVIDGYNSTAGIPANLRYYKTDFVDTNGLSKLTDKDKLDITKEMGAMIALRENSFEQVEQTKHWQTYENATQLTAIYYREDKTHIQEYLDKLNAQDKPVKLYVFGWGKNAGSEYASKKISVEDIPEPLIEVYKEIAK